MRPPRSRCGRSRRGHHFPPAPSSDPSAQRGRSPSSTSSPTSGRFSSIVRNAAPVGDRSTTQPPFQSDYWQEAISFRASGSTVHSEENTVLNEELTIHSGTYRQIGTAGKPPVETWATTSARNFHGRRVLRVRDSTSSVSTDGLLYVKNVFASPCTDGWYSFRTRVPIRQYNVFRYDGKDAGDVSVNGARITFSLTDPIPPR